MSFQVDCDQIINEYTKKLIKSLTNFKETDENFTICNNFILSKIKYATFPSINSHEVGRRVDGLCERLEIDNHGGYVPQVRNLFNRFTNYPECREHCQTDIHWGIIDFLFELAENPIQTFTKKLDSNPSDVERIFEDVTEICDEVVDVNLEMLKAELVSDVVVHPIYDSDSELSEWSSDGVCADESPSLSDHQNNERSIQNESFMQIKHNISMPQVKIVSVLTPPKKPPPYHEFQNENSIEWLVENVQTNWWSNEGYKCDVSQKYPNQANFCQLWQKHISTMSMSREEQISTISEYCLMREILWMFSVPTTCKIFHIIDGKISIAQNVSIPSVSLKGLAAYLQIFVEHMNYYNELITFNQQIMEGSNSFHSLPLLTYSNYAACINNFLIPIKEFVVVKEKIIKDQHEFNSIITLLTDFEPHFKMLKVLHRIHSTSVLDYHKYPPHICSAHLLAAIYAHIRNAVNPANANLALVIYLKTFRVYLSIIDTWWMEGTLDDWHSEFLIERDFTENNMVEFKTRQINSDQSFQLPLEISKIINEDPMLKMVTETLVQSASSLKILQQLNRLGEWKIDSKSSDLYGNFIAEIKKELSRFSATEEDNLNNNVEGITTGTSTVNFTAGHNQNKNEFDRMEAEKEILQIGDQFMLMAFKGSLDIAQAQIEQRNIKTVNVIDENDTLTMYNWLNNLSTMILPVDLIVFRICSNLLEIKLQVVNKFLTRIYKTDFKVLRHLQNLRKVLLLEASDLMHYFYTNLFNQIETDATWANGYHLTVQLNAIMCSRFSDLRCQIEINSNLPIETTDVPLAIQLINVKYEVSNNLSNVITEKTVSLYNVVFKFLLNVKWCIWTLENLRFPEGYKKRPPYAKLTIHDLVMRRLAVVRIWMLYSIQSIHNYLMEQVIQPLGIQMDEEIDRSCSLDEIIKIHGDFIQKVNVFCFQTKDQAHLKLGISQLFILVNAVKNEWMLSCEAKFNEYSNKNVDKLESTYIKCYQMIADTLTNEIYHKNNSHLEALCAAFNCSIPY